MASLGQLQCGSPAGLAGRGGLARKGSCVCAFHMVAHGEGVEGVIDLELELEPRSTDVDKATYTCIIWIWTWIWIWRMQKDLIPASSYSLAGRALLST